MYVIKRLTNETAINIGRQGENIATVIEFPLDEYIENYGAGTAQLVHIRPGDTAPYLCTTEQLDTALDWTITNEDTAYAGTGMCELRWVVDDTLAKSMIYKTVINPSITADSVLPDQYQSWYDAMMEAIEQKIIPIDDLKNNPVLNLIDTGLNAFGARIMPGEDLNWEKYLKPGSWIGAPDSQDPVKNKPDMGSGHYYRLIVKGLYDSGYSDVTPQYLIRIIEAEQGSKSETWTQVVRTYGFDDPEHMRIYPWVKLATSSDLDTLTTAVTANTKSIKNSVHLASGSSTAGTLLASDTDINQLLTGEYYWTSAATRPSANIPDNTAVRGRLWALDSGGSDIYCAQICYTSNFNWYIRYCTSKSSYTWTEWKQINGTPKQLSGITSLSDIPLGSNGYAQFDASVSPTGATAYFTYWCTGTNDRRSIIAVYTADSTAKAYVNVLHNADGVTWKGWKTITLS